jgi:hypothetical protein
MKLLRNVVNTNLHNAPHSKFLLNCCLMSLDSTTGSAKPLPRQCAVDLSPHTYSQIFKDLGGPAYVELKKAPAIATGRSAIAT